MRIPISLLLIDLYSACGISGDEAVGIALSDLYRREEKNYYGTIIRNNFSINNFIPYSDLDRNYLLRRYQNRHNYNHYTKMPLNGLQKRCNNDFRNLAKQRRFEKEQKIKEAFKEDSQRKKEYKQDLKGMTKESRRQLRKSRYRKK